MSKLFPKAVLLFTLIILVSACGPAAPTAAPVSPTASPVPATPVPPTVTPIPPTLVPTALPGTSMVAVPPGNPPTLDGTLSPGEWDSARREKFSDGSELLLMQNGGYLYLGIRVNLHTIWSVFLDRGDEIAVLHSSGSLGTAVYKRTESDWQPTRTFAWTLQDKSNSETARQQREQFLEKEGWLASLGTMGKPEEVEFQLAMPQGALRLAVAFPLPPNYGEAALWPAGLDDDVRTIDLLEGDTPAQLRFSPERWAVVMVAGYETAGPAPTPVSEATPIPPDGRSAGLIAFYSERDGNAEIYAINADGSAETRLTFNPAVDLAPDISPDGSQIVFVSDRDGNEEVYRMSYDGSDVVRLTHTPAQESYPYWSPDGTKIVFSSKRDDGQTYEVYLMNSDGTDQTRITHNSVSEEWAYLSPDMQKIVYAVGPFPQYNLYVMSVDGSDQRQVFSCDRMAALPKWSRDGGTIAFNYAFLSSGNILGDVGLINSDGEGFFLITTTGGNSVSESPYWSPDGSRIVFQSNRTGNFQIYVMNADGSEQVRLTHHRGNDYWPSWGPMPAKPYRGE